MMKLTLKGVIHVGFFFFLSLRARVRLLELSLEVSQLKSCVSKKMVSIHNKDSK